MGEEDQRTEMDRHEEGGANVDLETGRPTGATDQDGAKGSKDQADAPTEAPEELGGDPAVEHAPGGDL